ncbi:fasciclin domain-containing protein [Tellurirhabdus bombi]|uniref:fasciclin domain-containing protein n=1 Tax=Tellurirhabdus bombi TaxID=2907205 RepID=UPI001F4606F0|nr:fasciclin domain-containing protein [Tellurirhabdus bombi]
MKKNSFLSIVFSITFLMGTAACAQTTPTQGNTQDSSTQTPGAAGRESRVGSQGVSTGKDLAASASMSPNHTMLASALKVANQNSRMAAGTNYTVFAPTNDAFNKLPSGTMEKLLTPAYKQKLMGILGTHVVQGNLMAADLQDGQQLTTLSGEKLTVSKQADKVMLKDAQGNTATVIMADIKATNGVAHSVDTVLMPSK